MTMKNEYKYLSGIFFSKLILLFRDYIDVTSFVKSNSVAFNSKALKNLVQSLHEKWFLKETGDLFTFHLEIFKGALSGLTQFRTPEAL